ncbi:Sialic acid synthase [Methanonatronarchaeum thermophilum]|uniref:Sialic acid synthase n=1 Tax=Methanonatronarchaeum thermophilum TaxID=1927129 RepID=A0A1Y3G9G9_9EURY|nr:N-acetylneuraminate synthase family protein [Methanonatronarchaeum thermophilum]OUJ18091.1 Sialic acid synthase [Methanonatronarchaeum thermophilum]
MNKIVIDGIEISEESDPFFIAEIGINHNGSLDNAKEMIDMAADFDADAVKFQKREPDICVPEHKKDQVRETPWGDITYLEYKKKIEFGKKEYDEIDEYCKDKDIVWSASAWDLPSFEFIEQYDIPFHKVASAKLTDKKLLQKIKNTGKPVFLSTGGSTMQQIKKAVKIFEESNKLVIMQCNANYPSEINELDLNVIKTLKKEFPEHIIGYSGHEKGISPSLVAAALGAKVIERHITIDRAMWGSDQSASLDRPGLRRLIRDVKNIPKMLGNEEKTVYENEEKVMKKLRNKKTL